MNILHILKTRFEQIFYFYHHVLAGLFIFVSGIFACWILYVFIMTVAPLESIQKEANDAPVKQEALKRIKLWRLKRLEGANAQFTIPLSVFAQPSTAP